MTPVVQTPAVGITVHLHWRCLQQTPPGSQPHRNTLTKATLNCSAQPFASGDPAKHSPALGIWGFSSEMPSLLEGSARCWDEHLLWAGRPPAPVPTGTAPLLGSTVGRGAALGATPGSPKAERRLLPSDHPWQQGKGKERKK